MSAQKDELPEGWAGLWLTEHLDEGQHVCRKGGEELGLLGAADLGSKYMVCWGGGLMEGEGCFCEVF